MTLPSSSAISLSQVNTELGRSATATINLNESAVRVLAGVGGSGTTISMSNLRGKSNIFSFDFYGGTQLDLRTLAIQYGWNQVGYLFAQNYGVINSTTNGQYALTIYGPFPNGVVFTNFSNIVGKGGDGGPGAGPDGASSGSAGGGGNTAINVNTAVSINNVATISGGGGGGGGGMSGVYRLSYIDSKGGDTGYRLDFCSAGGGGGGGGGYGGGGYTGGSYSSLQVNWPWGAQALSDALYMVGLWNYINLDASSAGAAGSGGGGDQYNGGGGGGAATYYYRRDLGPDKNGPGTQTYYGSIGGVGGAGGYIGNGGGNGGGAQMGNVSRGSQLGAGGAGGIALQGNSLVTWLAYGNVGALTG